MVIVLAHLVRLLLFQLLVFYFVLFEFFALVWRAFSNPEEKTRACTFPLLRSISGLACAHLRVDKDGPPLADVLTALFLRTICRARRIMLFFHVTLTLAYSPFSF